MNIETTFTWERSPGEEIELLIGGEYTPAGTEVFSGTLHKDFVSVDWVEMPNGKRYEGRRLWFIQFADIDKMRTVLLNTAQKAQKK